MTLITAYQISQQADITLRLKRKAETPYWTWLFAILLAVFMGFRPVSWVFVDTPNYARVFSLYSTSDFVDVNFEKGDYLFSIFMFYSSKIMNVHHFFLIIDLIYIILPLLAIRKFFPGKEWLAFIMYIGAFSFWSAGTNGLRTGMSSAIFIYGLSKMNRKWFAFVLMLIAVGIHKSIALPIFALLLSYFYRNSKLYIILWFIAIPTSFFSGGFWESLFAGLGFDYRLDYLTADVDAKLFSSVGFRWDFLLYSALPVFVGLYVIIIKKTKTLIYSALLNIYIISNTFWILIISANYSNRFAYLSWFLYPIVLLYPFIRFNFWRYKSLTLMLVLVLHFIFSYAMWLIG
jgi:hypothetical protein